jgi:RNA polymerase sigma-70 factor, ECF subfamily
MDEMGENAGRVFWDEVTRTLRPFIARRVDRTEDVEDVLQDVFVRLQRGLEGLREEVSLRPWLFQVARSAIVEQQRARARHPLVRTPDSSEVDSSEPLHPAAQDDMDGELTSAMTACLSRFVAEIPSPYREAITLVDLQGVSQADAAAMAGISLPGMKSRVQRGRLQLRRMFEKACAVTLDRRCRIVDCEARRPGLGSRAG